MQHKIKHINNDDLGFEKPERVSESFSDHARISSELEKEESKETLPEKKRLQKLSDKRSSLPEDVQAPSSQR